MVCIIIIRSAARIMQYLNDFFSPLVSSPVAAAAVTAVLTAMSVYAAQHALLSKRDSRSALAWVAFCFLPLLGPLTYLLFGINRIHIRARRDYPSEAASPVSKDPLEGAAYYSEPPGSALRPLSRVGEGITGRGLVSVDSIETLRNGEGFYPAMLRDIASARQSVYCSTYIFRRDDTGRSIAAALSAARARGVDVRIIVDGLGEAAYPPRIGGLLKRRRLNFRRYNPITLVPPSLRLNMRNHRKLLVVDGSTAYTGGQNLSDSHLAARQNNPARTRDLHFRFTGKIVDDLQWAFLNDWQHCGDEEGGKGEASTDETEEGGNAKDGNGLHGSGAKDAHAPCNTLDPSASHWARVILDGPNEDLDQLNDLLVGVLSAARQRIWLMTPYFLPGHDLAGALIGARLRGVDVKIILPERTNIYLAHWATQHNLRYILARKLPVYLQPAPFVHTKAVLVDDGYALIGSANLDPRSLRLNFELGVEVFSPAFNADLHGYFEQCLAASTKLNESRLAARPYPIKVRDATAWLFSPYL